MIRAVRCDQPGFKSVEFESGFNVVLATRTLASSEKDSRNGAGKTTLLEIIHFCLGSSPDKKNRLMAEQLRGWTFTLDFDARGRSYRVSRNTADPRRVVIEGDFGGWPVTPRPSGDSGAASLPVKEWTSALGWLMFGLPSGFAADSFEPTFRSLISYFARRGRDAFSTPFEHHRKQLEWDKQVNNAFLLGLDEEYPAKLQRLKDQEAAVTELRKAIRVGAFPDLLGTIGELDAERVRLEELTNRRASELREFRVHPQYAEYQDRANELQNSIRRLNHDNAADRAMLAFYRQSLGGEAPADAARLARMYREAGLAWPGGVQQRLEDVEEFHRKLVANRRAFLESEISRLERGAASRDAQIREQSDQRADLLAVLDTHGALAEYAELQRLQSADLARLAEARSRIANLIRIEEIKSATRIEKEHLHKRARSLHDERRARRGTGNLSLQFVFPGPL